jgi:phosphoribosylanthranilate isomerase
MTRVKVCGLTTEHDADMVASAGASAVGMIFWPGSPRAVTAAQARRIVAVLPPFVQAVGVFVNASPTEVEDTAGSAGIDLVQLHGDERPEAWAACAWPIVKALTLQTYAGNPWLDRARVVLLDAHDPVRRGGTGASIDWTAARRCVGTRRFVLAGGLHAGNVGDAIAVARPDAIDVASGVERAPGQKDPARVRALFDAVRQADELHGRRPVTDRGEA